MAMCLRAGAEVVGAFKFICFPLLPSFPPFPFSLDIHSSLKFSF